MMTIPLSESHFVDKRHQLKATDKTQTIWITIVKTRSKLLRQSFSQLPAVCRDKFVQSNSSKNSKSIAK